MRAPSLPLLRLGALSLVAAAGVLAAPASAAERTTYTCNTLPETAALTTLTAVPNLPSSVAVGQSTGAIRVGLTAAVTDGWGQLAVSGTASVRVTVAGGGVNRSTTLLATFSSPAPAEEVATREVAFEVSAPAETFTVPGTATVTVDSLSFAETRFADRFGLGIVFPGGPYGECSLAPADQDATARMVTVTPAVIVDPPPPGGPSANDITSTSARICPRPGPRVPIVTRYVVLEDDRKLAESVDPNPCPTVTGLTPGTQYTLSIKTGPANGDDSQLTSEGSVTFTTLPSEGSEGYPPFRYTLSGAAALKTLTKGSIPLSGELAAQLSIATGTISADLTLNKAKGNLTALGFLPVTADVALQSTEKVTGSISGDKLTAVAKIRIKLPSVKAFGVELAGGANCQAKQVSAITLTSTQEQFKPTEGGPLAGTFSISDLTGCGFLTNIVSPLTKGSGNAIALNLAPKL